MPHQQESVEFSQRGGKRKMKNSGTIKNNLTQKDPNLYTQKKKKIGTKKMRK